MLSPGSLRFGETLAFQGQVASRRHALSLVAGIHRFLFVTPSSDRIICPCYSESP